MVTNYIKRVLWGVAVLLSYIYIGCVVTKYIKRVLWGVAVRLSYI